MDDYIYVFLFLGLLGILTILLFIMFLIWIIKKGVKNAIIEILETDGYLVDLKYTITDGILSALEQYENKNEENLKESIDE